MLVEGRDLDVAITTATPVDIRFQRHLVTANAELYYAMGSMEGFDPSAQPELQSIADSAEKRLKTVKFHIDAAMASVSTQKK